MVINRIPDENGNYGVLRNSGDGFFLPDELVSSYLESKGFVVPVVSDDRVESIVRNYSAYMAYIEQHPDYVPTSADKRKNAYETLQLIEYDEKYLTVDEAEKLFWQYFPEEDTRCEELRELIKTAKSQIREMYPDEN